MSAREETEMLQRATDHAEESHQCQRMSPCPYTGTNIINKISWAGEAADDQEEARLAMAISLNLQTDGQSQVHYEEMEMRTFQIQENKR